MDTGLTGVFAQGRFLLCSLCWLDDCAKTKGWLPRDINTHWDNSQKWWNTAGMFDNAFIDLTFSDGFIKCYILSSSFECWLVIYSSEVLLMNISVLTVNVKHINFSVLKYLLISCAILICRDKYELSISMFILLKNVNTVSVVLSKHCSVYLWIPTQQQWLNQWCKFGVGLLECLTNGRWKEVFRKPLKTIFFLLPYGLYLDKLSVSITQLYTDGNV